MRLAVVWLAGLLAVASGFVAQPVPRELREGRIVGGNVTTISSYPFAAALLFSDDLIIYNQICGGTIINNRSILSAAHCFFLTYAFEWRIRVGSTWASSGGTVHNVAQIISHPNFNQYSFLDNDVAILHSSVNLNWVNNAVAPAAIAGSNYNVGDNQVVWAIGWGRIYFEGPQSEQLRHVQVWTINQATCRNRYAELFLTVTDNMLCSGWLDVGGRDQCQGDSGGPLIHNNVIVGICSFGWECAHPHFPGINARVSRHTTWIVNNA